MMKRSKPADIRNVDLAACSTQLLHSSKSIVDDGCVKRRLTCTICRIEVCVIQAQKIYYRNRTPCSCEMKRRHSLRITASNIGAITYGCLYVR